MTTNRYRLMDQLHAAVRAANYADAGTPARRIAVAEAARLRALLEATA